jgi:hypothetical protein
MIPHSNSAIYSDLEACNSQCEFPLQQDQLNPTSGENKNFLKYSSF